MTFNISPTPAFGTADLSNCEREQIQYAGAIQPHGALLLLSEPDLIIVQISANIAHFLDDPTSPLGQPLASLGGSLPAALIPHLTQPLTDQPLALRGTLARRHITLQALIHRPAGGGLLIELEPAADDSTEDSMIAGQLESALQSILVSMALRNLADEAARFVKNLTGYDRVMVYQFDQEGHGQVFAEQCERGLEPYLGNRYPATDIPQIARRLYLRHRVRLLVDVNFQPVKLEPALSPISDAPFDMSLCTLRASSPIHNQYLKNMGVRATLVMSLVIEGRLWGLIACHHYAPYFVSYKIRAACELLAEAIATRIAALQSFTAAQAELSARRLEQRMAEALTRDGRWRNALFDNSQALLQPTRATGVALVYEGDVTTSGDVPATQDIRAIAAWLDKRGDVDGRGDAPVVTDRLSAERESLASIAAIASGILAVRITGAPGAYLIWIRPEEIRTVTWGGDPSKPMIIGDQPTDLSPRRSFAQWQQVMRQQSQPWTEADIAAARVIGCMVSDVVLQSSSVRLLIAQDQLDQLRQDVGASSQAVIITDFVGDILLINQACWHLIGETNQQTSNLADLPPLFSEPKLLAERLRSLQKFQLGWRCESAFRRANGASIPVQIRADPIFASADRVLGYVLMLTDMTNKKAANVARRQFQDGVLDHTREVGALISSTDGLSFSNLLHAIVENGQLAGLEITDRIDLTRMPDQLSAVRDSVRRATILLRNLLG